jgi:hypothetical protein
LQVLPRKIEALRKAFRFVGALVKDFLSALNERSLDQHFPGMLEMQEHRSGATIFFMGVKDGNGPTKRC